MSQYNTNTDDNILDDIFDKLPHKDDLAETHLRFWNFVIDSFVVYVLVGVIVLGLFFLGINFPPTYTDIATPTTRMWDYIIMGTMAIIYYTASEFFFNGKTLGKLLTRTRAVTLDNQPMDFATTLKRSIFRVVPFEAFSFLGSMPSGWHDRWSDTKVILDKDSKE